MKKIMLLGLTLSLFFCGEAQAQWCKKKKEKATNQANQSSQGQQSIVGQWELTFLEGENINNLYPEKKPTVNIDDKQTMIFGNNSCNSYSCSLTIHDYKIKFTSQFTQTLRACEGQGEQKFMAALETITSYTFTENNTLDLIAGDRGVMQLKRIIKTNKKRNK